MDHRIADGSVFECLVCPAPDVMFASLGVIPNGLPSTEVEVEALGTTVVINFYRKPHGQKQ